MKKLAVIFLLAMANVANAAFPEGQWTVDTYKESTGAFYSKVGICIKADGTWNLTTPIESSGSGYWMMRGNDIHLHGNLHDSLELNESVELTRVTSRLLTGYWQEWINGGSLNLYFTTKWTFSSATCLPPA
jgi:hypothetical protein